MSLITHSRPTPSTHLLTLTSPPDNRLTPALLSELAAHLDAIEGMWRSEGGGIMDPRKREATPTKGAGAVVITSGCKGFFSNGLDYENATKDARFFELRDLREIEEHRSSSETFDPVLYRLLTFPLVTVAAINGHAFAGGMVLALACDFRVMTSGRGMMCMNEVTFGSPLPNSFVPLLAQRIPHPQHFRDTLMARRWKQAEAKSIGLLDEIVADEEVVKRAVELGEEEGKKCAGGSWGYIKDQAHRSYIEASQSRRQILMPPQEAASFWARVGKDPAKAKL